MDRRNYESWASVGGTALRQRAREKVRRILEEHQPEPLPTDAAAALDTAAQQAQAGHT